MAEPARIKQAAGVERAQDVAQRLRDAVGVALAGKADVVERAVITILARGHLLIEDIPGVGKTTLARALARAIGAQFRRVQCTSDLMPSDLLGVNVYQSAERRFEFKPGPIFTHVLLADEINRATPKTQSALLEAMSERQVTVDGVTHRLEEPFLVIATQNPDDNAGTYPLPDSQLDRFLVRTRVGYPSAAVEKALLLSRKEDTAEDVVAAVSLEALVRAQHEIDHVVVDEAVLDYAHAIVSATRQHEAISVGVSPRGAKAFLRAACARALVHGRAYVIPDDVSEMAVPVLAHRVRLMGSDVSLGALLGEARRDDAERVIRDLVARIEVPL
jgi:MoxR-like ATPase